MLCIQRGACIAWAGAKVLTWDGRQGEVNIALSALGCK